MYTPYTNVVGFDDAPFPVRHRGDVLVVGAVFSGHRLDGVLSGRVRRDGVNATARLEQMVTGSRFADHLQLVMLQGVAFAGFNVIDIERLHRRTGLPVLVVVRKEPDLDAIRRALLDHVPGGSRKWRLIERMPRVESLSGVCVQRVGLDRDSAQAVIYGFALHGVLPEPLRTAHLIAGGIVQGESRHRP